MSTVDFSRIDTILDAHGRSKQAVIAILQDIQEEYNYLPKEIFPYVARALDIGEARLYGVATFYADFSLEPKGKHIFRCCDGTACHVRRSQPILDRLRTELGLTESHTTTEDLLYTVETVSHPNMTPDKASALLRKLREEENDD